MIYRQGDLIFEKDIGVGLILGTEDDCYKIWWITIGCVSLPSIKALEISPTWTDPIQIISRIG